MGQAADIASPRRKSERLRFLWDEVSARRLREVMAQKEDARRDLELRVGIDAATAEHIRATGSH